MRTLPIIGWASARASAVPATEVTDLSRTKMTLSRKSHAKPPAHGSESLPLTSDNGNVAQPKYYRQEQEITWGHFLTAV